MHHGTSSAKQWQILPDCELRGSPDLLNKEQVACSIQASPLHLQLMHLLELRPAIDILSVVSATWLQSQVMVLFANAANVSRPRLKAKLRDPRG